jgi:hypothetical protein
LQAEFRRASELSTAAQACQALFLLMAIVSQLACTKDVPYLRNITVALSTAFAPLLELALMLAIILVLVATILHIQTTSDERITSLNILASHSFNQLVSGMSQVVVVECVP